MSHNQVINLDLSRHKLLVKPNDPLPQFYPPPRAVMVTPIYDTPVPSQDGSYRSNYHSSESPIDSPRSRDYGDRPRRHSHPHNRGVYTDSEYEDSRPYIPSQYSAPHQGRHYDTRRYEDSDQDSYADRSRRRSSDEYSNRYTHPHGHGSRSQDYGYDSPRRRDDDDHVRSSSNHPHSRSRPSGATHGAPPPQAVQQHPSQQYQHSRPQFDDDDDNEDAESYDPHSTPHRHPRSRPNGGAPHGAPPSQADHQHASQQPQQFQSQFLQGLHLPPATKALLQYAERKGYLDEIGRYLKVLPPAPDFCYSKCTGRRKAVCIGINYVGQKDELKGCANDARNMRDFLMKTYGFQSSDILLITDEEHGSTQVRPTRKEMFNAMAWLVKGAKMHDSLFFHYSGHGGQSPDASGKEADGMDEVIFPVDYDQRGEADSDIIDDELHEALVDTLAPGVRLTAIFDSCHSGTVLDLPYLHSAHGRLRGLGHISKRTQRRGVAPSADVICFAACKDDETSADTREGNVAVGAMSYAFIQTIEQNTHQTYEEILKHLRDILIPKYGQKAQISGTHPLDLTRQFTL